MALDVSWLDEGFDRVAMSAAWLLVRICESLPHKAHNP